MNQPEHTPEDQPEQTQDDDRVAALEAEIAQMKDQMLRALAEADNTRKRALKDRDDAGKYAISGFARDLLTVADNFRRALDSVPPDLAQSDDRVKNLMTGIEAVEKDLLNIFERHGVKKIMPMDEPFNPNWHEVMFETPGTGKPAGTIVQVMDAGYFLHDRLLRPARVGVAKADDGQAHQVDTEA